MKKVSMFLFLALAISAVLFFGCSVTDEDRNIVRALVLQKNPDSVILKTILDKERANSQSVFFLLCTKKENILLVETSIVTVKSAEGGYRYFIAEPQEIFNCSCNYGEAKIVAEQKLIEQR